MNTSLIAVAASAISVVLALGFRLWQLGAIIGQLKAKDAELERRLDDNVQQDRAHRADTKEDKNTLQAALDSISAEIRAQGEKSTAEHMEMRTLLNDETAKIYEKINKIDVRLARVETKVCDKGEGDGKA